MRICLVSQEDEDDDSLFVPTGLAHSTPCLSATQGTGEAVQPQSSMNMHDMCKCATETLEIPWCTVVREVPTYHYKGKKSPQVSWTMGQLLQLFSELQEEY